MHSTIKNFVKKSVLALAAGPIALLLSSGDVNAAALYSNLAPNNGPNGPIGDKTTNANGAIFDDVQVDNFIWNPSELQIQVNSLTFGIVQLPGAPSVRVNAYLGNTIDLEPAFPGLSNPSIQSVGFVEIPANLTAVRIVTPATVILGSPVIITPTQTSDDFSEFAAGVRFTAAGTNTQVNTQDNSWAVALPNLVDANLDGAWDLDLAGGPTNAMYSLFDDNSDPIYTTFALAVDGTIVPEPTFGALILGAGAMLLSRRPRRAH